MKVDARAWLVVSATSLAASLLLAQAQSAAIPQQELRQTLPAHRASVTHLRVTHDPFVAFTVAHRTLERLGTPGVRVIDAPARVPNPGGPNAGADAAAKNLVLCDTWTTTGRTQARYRPTAVFLVGNRSVIAVHGDLVGGYRVNTIAPGDVTFATGEKLGLGDCTQRQPSAPMQTPLPNLTLPPIGPASFPNFPPQSPPEPPPPTAHGPSSSRAARGNTRSSYGSSIYGGSVPTRAPHPMPFSLFSLPSQR